MTDPFPCDRGCGACCRRAGVLGGMLPVNEEGHCLHLMPNGDCSIYETRPEVCRVDTMIDKVGGPRKEWVDLTIKVCNLFRKEDGLGPLVQIGE